LYVARATYVSALLLLMCTAWLLLAGTQVVRNVGDFARFGAALFLLLAPLQLALGLFFSAVLAASGVAQEKDRRTLVLLLLTNLSNSELVFGKLLASMLTVLMLLASSLPVFMVIVLFGGISFDQIGRVFAVTLLASLVAGSLGSTLALWREKTFQTLSLTVLALVAWLALGEAVARGVFGMEWLGIPASQWAIGISPWQAILAAARPVLATDSALPWVGSSIHLFFLLATAAAALLNLIAIAWVRVWNPSRESRAMKEEEAGSPESIWGAEHDLAQRRQATPALPRSVHAAPGGTRPVWDNPVLWREISTWAYGRKVLVIRVAYLLLAALAAAALVSSAHGSAGITLVSGSLTLVPLFLLSLVLINAQAVTALTSERDVKALDLLLVTDLTAKEFVFGKLWGVLYNTKEMVLIPLALSVYLCYADAISLENLVYLIGGLLVMDVFVAMLGIHAGLTYENSRTAIGVSLGTLFFLFVGVATCMRMMIAFSGSFHVQLQPFLAFMVGGWAGLYVALGSRNPSSAIFWASAACPFATFFAITSFWKTDMLAAFLVTTATYGFTTAAILIPAIFEFDVATGRASIGGD
jgi:ABC-type transport system involved in multi-copper enzyme maturation permease subunit